MSDDKIFNSNYLLSNETILNDWQKSRYDNGFINAFTSLTNTPISDLYSNTRMYIDTAKILDAESFIELVELAKLKNDNQVSFYFFLFEKYPLLSYAYTINKKLTLDLFNYLFPNSLEISKFIGSYEAHLKGESGKNFLDEILFNHSEIPVNILLNIFAT